MKIRVDRIEGEFAVCEFSDGSFADIRISEFPTEIYEGAIIEINEDSAFLRKDEESEKRKKNFERMNKLFFKK